MFLWKWQQMHCKMWLCPSDGPLGFILDVCLTAYGPLGFILDNIFLVDCLAGKPSESRSYNWEIQSEVGYQLTNSKETRIFEEQVKNIPYTTEDQNLSLI